MHSILPLLVIPLAAAIIILQVWVLEVMELWPNHAKYVLLLSYSTIHSPACQINQHEGASTTSLDGGDLTMAEQPEPHEVCLVLYSYYTNRGLINLHVRLTNTTALQALRVVIEL